MEKNLALLKALMAETRSRYFDIPENVWSLKLHPEKWSKREIMGHLADSARYNLMNFTEIPASEVVFIIKPYPQDHLVAINGYRNFCDHDLLALWLLLNKQICNLLLTLNEADLKRKIRIYDIEHTLNWLIEDYLSHMKHHLDQIFSPGAACLKPPSIKTVSEAMSKLLLPELDQKKEFISLMKYADLEIEYYKPHKTDKQGPHLKDEVYVIAEGSGSFYLEGESFSFKKNDVIFVSAGDVHRFTDFSDDFATWVIFYGIKNE